MINNKILIAAIIFSLNVVCPNSLGMSTMPEAHAQDILHNTTIDCCEGHESDLQNDDIATHKTQNIEFPFTDKVNSTLSLRKTDLYKVRFQKSHHKPQKSLLTGIVIKIE